MPIVTWQGTEQELDRLQEAVARNCECIAGMLGLPPTTCRAHEMLGEQSALDHLLYVYRTRGVFVTREFYALPMPTGRRASKRS
jgi:hypothetical protein